MRRVPAPESRDDSWFGSARQFLRQRCSRLVAWYRANPRKGAAIAAAGGLAAVGLIVLVAVLSQPIAPTGRVDGTPPAATPVERATPVPSDTPSPSAAPAEWAALELPPYEPVAQLAPSISDASGISTTAAFTFRSLTSVPAVELAAGLVAEPVVDLHIEPGPTADVAMVRPASPLVENTRYRIHLFGADGALAGDWTFRTGGRLHAVRLLPDNFATQVPVDTGIEIEFDQDGVVDIGAHFSIDPAVDGDFEAHGRTWAFVPSAALAPSTLYTVTVTAGLGIEGSTQVLESDVRFSFETGGPGSAASEMRIAFERSTHEARPDERTAIPVQVHGDTGEALATTREVVVYALGTLDAARAAAAILAEDRGWAIRSSNGGVPTEDLVRTGAFDATLGLRWSNQYVELPTGFAAGWYLVEIPQDGRDAQLVLQVTDLAAYVLVSDERTVAWVNDLAVDAAAAGATVRLPDGAILGRTDAAGLLDTATPEVLIRSDDEPRTSDALVVSATDGRSVIAMPDGQGQGFWFPGLDGSSKWWHLLGTDRDQYRTTDTIRVWGLVRARADRSVPGGLELRLFQGWSTDGPPIARQAVDATSRGAIIGELGIRDLPSGDYQVALYVDEERVSQTSVRVTEIRKPTFQVEVATERRAYISGEAVRVRASARFFDGSSAPGLRLRMSAHGVSDDSEHEVTLDAAGAAELSLVATTSAPMPEGGGVGAGPADPEEGASHGNADFVVFPSSVWIDATAELADDTVTISGHLSHVDLAAVEEQMATGWWGDPGGDPIAGGSVQIVVDRVTWRPVQVGTTYDFLLKKSVPLLNYEREVQRLATFDPTTTADGSFVHSLPFTGPGGVEVTLRARDEQGRVIERALWAQTPAPSSASAYPYLESLARGCGAGVSLSAAVGEDVTLTMKSGEGLPSADGRTLFIVGHLGIDDVVFTTEASFQRVFEESDVPSVTVRAVRVSPAGYLVTNDVVVGVDEREKAIDVVVEPGRERYAPGEDATVTITTSRADGSPISADVVVQAIDLKLFAMGAAHEISTAPLMAPVSAGFTDAYAAHRVPSPPYDLGCGAATGGDPRGDFEDTAAFQLIRTGADGRGSAAFTLPDDITSWVVSATAMGDGLESGTSSVEVPVGLPFFVDAAIAPEYLAGEEPILQLRAFGDGLEPGQRVRFTVAAPSLGLDPTVIEGAAYEPVRAALPVLTLGEHELTISGERIGGAELSDSVLRTIRVVPTRLRTTRTATELVTDPLRPQGGDGLTTLVVSDGGRGSLVRLLQELATGTSARFDAALAADLARQILIDDFGMSAASLPESGFAGRADGHPSEGLALLPYASADLSLTARTALVAPERVSSQFLRDALRTAADEAPTRERRIIALAGLAGLGEDVLAELRATAADDLTVRERAWLALGLLESGDEVEARAIERSILTEHGQRLDRWVRLDIGMTTPERMEATASVLLLAARLRDPVAADLSRYLLDNPTAEYLPALEQVGFARSAMEWLPRDEARFAWTIDGDRREETIAPGATFVLTLTADQRESLVVERIAGDVLVTTTWAGDARYDELPADPTVTIGRVVSPADRAPADQLVRVTLDVTFDAEALDGCYQVTDLVPSGLSPVVAVEGWGDPTVITPYEVEGQRVSWCIGSERPTARLAYSARVVSAGTYRWEPAVIQHPGATAIGASTAVATYTID